MKMQKNSLRRFLLTSSVLLTASGISGAYAQNMTPLTGGLQQSPVSATNAAATPAATPAAGSAGAAYQQPATGAIAAQMTAAVNLFALIL